MRDGRRGGRRAAESALQPTLPGSWLAKKELFVGAFVVTDAGPL
jgi:hypothetical protein